MQYQYDTVSLKFSRRSWALDCGHWPLLVLLAGTPLQPRDRCCPPWGKGRGSRWDLVSEGLPLSAARPEPLPGNPQKKRNPLAGSAGDAQKSGRLRSQKHEAADQRGGRCDATTTRDTPRGASVPPSWHCSCHFPRRRGEDDPRPPHALNPVTAPLTPPRAPSLRSAVHCQWGS